MTAEELKMLLSTPAALFFVMLFGSLASMLKQISDAKKNGTDASLGSYLAHWPETAGTIITNALGFLTLVVTDQLNFASALGIGYAANSAADLLRSGGRSASLSGKQGGFVRPLLLVLLLAVTVPIVFALQGCASLGIPAPKTFNERLAAGYVSATSVRTSARTLLNGAVITSSDAENLQKQADVAREGLDVARTLPSLQAEDKLQTTLLILQAAQSYLCGKNPNDPNCAR